MRSALSKFLGGALLVVSGLATGIASGGVAHASSSGFNDWSCQPSAEHPDPVVLLHGLGGNGPGNYAYLGPELANAGYCAYSPTYGQAAPWIPLGGTVPIAESADEIAGYIDDVLAATGATKVDIVGHSEGGFQSLYGPKVVGYSAEVDTVVALAPPTHGTTFASLVPLADALGLRPLVDIVLNTFGCQACSDLIIGGTAVNALTDGPIAQPGVSYTIIASQYDALVTPTETSFVEEPGVNNLYVQDVCAQNFDGHVGLAFDPTVAGMVKNALDPENPQPVPCTPGVPF